MYEVQRKTMTEIWSDPVKRAGRIQSMREAGINRRKHKDIEISQVDDPRRYSREYQKKWRAAHPGYYAEKSRARRAKLKEQKIEEEIKRCQE